MKEEPSGRLQLQPTYLLTYNFHNFQARTYLDPAEIFKGESEECIEKVETTIRVLKEYKLQFENTRNNIDSYFKDGAKVIKWEFSSDLVFTRFDQFIQRLELVQVI